MEAGDGFVFGIFDDEVAVIFGPVVEFEETVFAGAGTEEHAVVFVGTGNGLDVEVEIGMGGMIAGWQAMADEEAEVAVDRVLRWGDKGRPNPAVGKARTSNLEEEFLREVAEVGDVFCAVADLEDFELGAVAEVEGGASGFGDEEESEDGCEEERGEEGEAFSDLRHPRALRISGGRGGDSIAEAGGGAGADVSDGLAFVDALENVGGWLALAVGEGHASCRAVLGAEIDPGGGLVDDLDDFASGGFCGSGFVFGLFVWRGW